MSNALFSFDDREPAERAVRSLAAAGLAADAVQLHAREPGPDHSTAATVDELVTGGFVGNFKGLFENLFEWGKTPHDPGDYAETVERGGAVVSVEARTDEDRATVDRVMGEAQPGRRTGWSLAPERGD